MTAYIGFSQKRRSDRIKPRCPNRHTRVFLCRSARSRRIYSSRHTRDEWLGACAFLLGDRRSNGKIASIVDRVALLQTSMRSSLHFSRQRGVSSLPAKRPRDHCPLQSGSPLAGVYRR
ncbi:MAG: hypothetical protein LBO72_00670 [Helicobacteraceae bacterium]|nr:hypothetical protein [Helicobacteraceae bacterium]